MGARTQAPGQTFMPLQLIAVQQKSWDERRVFWFQSPTLCASLMHLVLKRLSQPQLRPGILLCCSAREQPSFACKLVGRIILD